MTSEEIVTIAKSLQLGKSQEEDDFVAEFYKTYADILALHMSRTFLLTNGHFHLLRALLLLQQYLKKTETS